MATTSSMFALHRDTIAELEKLNLSPELQAILTRAKGPKIRSKDIVTEALDILEKEYADKPKDWRSLPG
jgi:hypothetical protein